MATYFARKSGNINAADVWATTPTGTAADVFSTFTADDILVANSFTVTLNVNTAVGTVRNDTSGGASAGGSFALSNGVTLTANVVAGTSSCVTLSSTVSATVVGSITGGTAANAHGISHGSSGTLAVTGNVTGGSGSGGAGAKGISHGLGTLTVTGNVTGGTVFACHGISTTGLCTVTGTITGGSSVSGGAEGISHSGGGTVTIIGTAVGGSGTNAGVSVTSTGTAVATRAKGGPLVSSGVGVSAASTSIVNVDEIEYGDLGASPTSGPIRLTDKTSNVCLIYRPSLSKKTLLDLASTNLLPSTNNVRSGIVYNAGQTTGTMIVPPAASVKVGVPVDNTVGTAALAPEDVWNVLTSNITTPDSIGERLKNCSTIASVGQQLSDAVSN